MGGWGIPRILLCLLPAAYCLLIPPSAFAWIEGGYSFRRPIDVTWEAERATGDELAVADLYTAGHLRADGADLRVATGDGRLLATRVLMVGPGDRARSSSRC